MFLSFICFSKLVILVNTGQLVENNTTYARDIITSFRLRMYNPKFRSTEVQKARLEHPKSRSSEGLLRVPEVQKFRSLEGLFRAPEVQKSRRLV